MALELLNLLLELSLLGWDDNSTILQHEDEVVGQVKRVVSTPLQLLLLSVEELFKVMQLELVKILFFAVSVGFLDFGVSQEGVLDAVVLALGSLLQNNELLFLSSINDMYLLLRDSEHHILNVGELDNEGQFAQQCFLPAVRQFVGRDPLSCFRKRQNTRKILINEVDIFDKWNLLKTNGLLLLKVRFRVNLQPTIDHLQVKDPVGTTGSSENQAAWVIAALPEAGWLLVPELVLVFSLVFFLGFWESVEILLVHVTLRVLGSI